MDFSNRLIVQWGKFLRSTGTITDYNTYTDIFPLSFPNKCYSGTCATGTANGVVGAEFNATDGTTLQWSMKPNHNSTTNLQCFFIVIGN